MAGFDEFWEKVIKYAGKHGGWKDRRLSSIKYLRMPDTSASWLPSFQASRQLTNNIQLSF